MTKQQIKAEFARWIDAGRPNVWYKAVGGDWCISSLPTWRSLDLYYIVDDKQAELRKLQIDKPSTKFQVKYSEDSKWVDCSLDPSWTLLAEYRVKPKEWYEYPDMVGKPVWVRDSNDGKWYVDIFKKYREGNNLKFVCEDSDWKYAKPVKCEDLYQGL